MREQESMGMSEMERRAVILSKHCEEKWIGGGFMVFEEGGNLKC